MSSVIIPKNHICLSASQDISTIAKSLFNKHPLQYFGFARIYSDGSFMNFATHPEFLEHYYKMDYKFLPAINFANNQITYHLTNTNDSLESATLDLKERFSIHNFFLMIEKKTEYLDVFGFGSAPNLSQPMNFYLNNLEELEKFTLFFKEKANHIIQLASQNKLSFTGNTHLEYQNILNTIDNSPKSNALLNKLASIIEAKLQEIIYDLNISLTQREKICLIYAFLGIPAKVIGDKLNISHRTVETHLENAKKKFGFRNKLHILKLLKT